MADKARPLFIFALMFILFTSEMVLAQGQKGCVPECKQRCLEIKAKRMRPCMKLCTKCCKQCQTTIPPVCKNWGSVTMEGQSYKCP